MVRIGVLTQLQMCFQAHRFFSNSQKRWFAMAAFPSCMTPLQPLLGNHIQQVRGPGQIAPLIFLSKSPKWRGDNQQLVTFFVCVRPWHPRGDKVCKE